jgi:hypothetical protein
MIFHGQDQSHGHKNLIERMNLSYPENLSFALNSKLVIFIVENGNDVTKFGNILATYKHIFQLHFRNYLVEFNGRQTNKVACALIKVAIFIVSSNIFIPICNTFPYLIMNKMQ